MVKVIFDVGNVLLDWDVRYLYRKLLPNDIAIMEFLDEVGLMEMNVEFDRGRSFACGIAELCQRFPHRADLIEAFDVRWQETVAGAIQGSLAILDSLAQSGVPLYAITNFSGEKWRASCDRFPFLEERFRDVVVSGHEGLTKPEPEIFNRLLRRNSLKSRDCIFIDDSRPNVIGARAVGMDAILFQSPDALKSELHRRDLGLWKAPSSEKPP
ncbi:MAG: HAD family hydrolase [Hyphomicrobiaceae bacterium]